MSTFGPNDRPRAAPDLPPESTDDRDTGMSAAREIRHQGSVSAEAVSLPKGTRTERPALLRPQARFPLEAELPPPGRRACVLA
jgi:hypothetical protein